MQVLNESVIRRSDVPPQRIRNPYPPIPYPHLKRPILIIFIVLLIDQAVKFWIKTNMYLGQEFHIAGDWFIIHFTENNGMAFGMEFAGEFGKLFLSLFRIVAVAGIGWYLNMLVKQKAHHILITSIALIFAGAMGNIIVGILGGIIGGWLFGKLGVSTGGGLLGSLATSVIGAVILVYLLSFISKK